MITYLLAALGGAALLLYVVFVQHVSLLSYQVPIVVGVEIYFIYRFVEKLLMRRDGITNEDVNADENEGA